MTSWMKSKLRRSMACIACAGLLALTVGCGTSGGPPGGNADGTAGGAAADTVIDAGAASGLPPELVHDTQELIRLAGEYNALAAQVQNAETFTQHRDELSRIESELLPYYDNVLIGENKLTSSQKADYHQQYYDTQVMPLMNKKSQEQRRITSLVP
jgi:hypothetical protein